MPQFCILVYANYPILTYQRGGGHGPMALPPKHAPGLIAYKFDPKTHHALCRPITAIYVISYTMTQRQQANC